MENENIVNEIETVEEPMIEVETAVEPVATPEESDGANPLAWLAFGVAIVGLGALALHHKIATKIEDAKINSLKKKGYVVYKPEPIEECALSNSENEIDPEKDSEE